MRPLLTAPIICAITAHHGGYAGEAQLGVYHDNNNTPTPAAQHTGNETHATPTGVARSRSQRGQGHAVTKRHGYDASAITP